MKKEYRLFICVRLHLASTQTKVYKMTLDVLHAIFISQNESSPILKVLIIWTVNIAIRFTYSFTCALLVFHTKLICMHSALHANSRCVRKYRSHGNNVTRANISIIKAFALTQLKKYLTYVSEELFNRYLVNNQFHPLDQFTRLET